MRTIHAILALVGVISFIAAPARAQLQFTLNTPTQTYAQGTFVTWSGTFLNTGLTTLTFSGISFSGLPTGLTTDDTLYFTSLDGTSLGMGASVTTNFFTSAASSSLAPASYNSTVTVSYAGGSPSPNDASATFNSTITPSAAIPEPSTLGLLSLSLSLSWGTMALRRRHYLAAI